MKRIILTKGKYAVVDDEDYEWLNQWKWSYLGNGYAVRGNKNNKMLYMHREILKPGNGMQADHRNGNKLDNRKENLRIATFVQNNRNKTKQQGLSSIYKGVCYKTYYKNYKGKIYKNSYWLTKLMKNYKEIYIGLFKKENHAALAYDLWANDLFGEFAKLNFRRAI